MSHPANGEELCIPDDLQCDLPEVRPIPSLQLIPIRRRRQPAVPRDLQPLDMVIVKEANKTAWIGLYLTYKVSLAVPMEEKPIMHVLVPCQAKFQAVPAQFVKTLLEGIGYVNLSEVNKRDFDVRGAKAVLREMKSRAFLFLLGQDIKFHGIPEQYIPEALEILAEIPPYMLHLRANGAHTMVPPLDEDVKQLDAQEPVLDNCFAILNEDEPVTLAEPPLNTKKKTVAQTKAPADAQAPVTLAEPPLNTKKKTLASLKTPADAQAPVTLAEPPLNTKKKTVAQTKAPADAQAPVTFSEPPLKRQKTTVAQTKAPADAQAPVTLAEPPLNTKKKTVAQTKAPADAQAPVTFSEPPLNTKKKTVAQTKAPADAQAPVTFSEPPLKRQKTTVAQMKAPADAQAPVTLAEPPLNTKKKTVAPLKTPADAQAPVTLGEPPLKKQKTTVTKSQPSNAKPKLLKTKNVKRKLL